MSRFDDLKEQFKTQSAQVWEKIQESTAFNHLRDRYENLSTRSQKIVVIGSSLIALLFVLSIPLQFLSSATDQVSLYEDQRELIHDLFKIQQDSQSSTGLTPGPNAMALQSQIDGELKNSMLAPEQIRGSQIDQSSIPGIPKEYVEAALQVSLAKLNLRQVVDIGYQILNIHPTLKMVDLVVEPNMQDSRYFDVVYKIAALKVPVFLPPPPIEDEKPKKGDKKPAKPSDKKGSGDE